MDYFALTALNFTLIISFVAYKSWRYARNENGAAARLQAILDHSPAEVYLKDRQGRYLQISKRFETLFDVKNEDLVGKLPTEVFPPSIATAPREHDLQVLQSGETVVAQQYLETSLGMRHLHTIKFPTFDASGNVNGLGAVVCDISEQIEARDRAATAEADLVTERNRLAEVLALAQSNGWTYDIKQDKFGLEGLTQKMQLAFGTKNSTLVGLFKTLDKASRLVVRSEILPTLPADNKFDVELRSNYFQNNYSWIRVSGRGVEHEGELVQAVGFVQCIENQKQMEQELRAVASADPLTGLLNRRGLSEKLNLLVPKYTAKAAILSIDLDNFKTINDREGHGAGDTVLVAVADALRNITSKSDFVARVGGDEFTIVIPNIISATQAERFAKKLQSFIAEKMSHHAHPVRLSSSVGISIWNLEGSQHYETAMTESTIALRYAKKGHKSQILIFKDEMRQQIESKQQEQDAFDAGLDNDEFEPFFQPQVDLQSNKLVGLEVLARWNHPEHGLKSAGSFITNNLNPLTVGRLDQVMISKSFAAVRRMKTAVDSVPLVSINLSQASLLNPNLLDFMRSELKRNNHTASDFNLEVVETVFLSDEAEKIIKNVRSLQKIGFQIELDDFGTEYASMSNLHRLPVNGIKIDRSFVKSIDKDIKLRQLTETIVYLADKMNLRLVVEGLETDKELEVLREIGCTQVQGHLIAKPMSIDELKKWMRKAQKHQIENV